MGLKNSLKLIVRNTTVHSDAILFYELFKIALVMFKQVFFLTDHVFIEFVRSRTNLADKVKIALMFDKTFSYDFNEV